MPDGEIKSLVSKSFIDLVKGIEYCRKGKEMKYLDISNTNERMIKFGLSMPDRYKAGYVETDPWWNVHLMVKKDCEKKKMSFLLRKNL